MTIINEMNNKTGTIEEKAVYSIEAKKALIAYVHQIKKNFNTWLYPADMEGIKESKLKKGVYYYEDTNRDVIIQAFTK